MYRSIAQRERGRRMPVETMERVNQTHDKLISKYSPEVSPEKGGLTAYFRAVDEKAAKTNFKVRCEVDSDEEDDANRLAPLELSADKK